MYIFWVSDILKAKNMRYKKAIAKHMNLDYIKQTLWEIQEECENVRWFIDSDDENLINALDGNEDEAYEFKMEFACLCAECEKMLEDMNEFWIDEDFENIFNNFFVAIRQTMNFLGSTVTNRIISESNIKIMPKMKLPKSL